MVIECKSCHAQAGTPQPARGVFIVLPAVAISGALCGLLGGPLSGVIFENHTDVMGQDSLIFALPFLALFSWLFWQIPRWRMTSRHRHTACPHCGACDWGRPRYSGFRV